LVADIEKPGRGGIDVPLEQGGPGKLGRSIVEIARPNRSCLTGPHFGSRHFLLGSRTCLDLDGAAAAEQQERTQQDEISELPDDVQVITS
jgi:hypothetical protein